MGALGYLRRERDQDDRRNVFVVRTNDGAEFLEGFKRIPPGEDDAEGRHGASAGQRAKEPAFAAIVDGFALAGVVQPARPRHSMPIARILPTPRSPAG